MEKKQLPANRSCGYSVTKIIEMAQNAFNQHPSGAWENHKRHILSQIAETERDYDNIFYEWKFCVLRYPSDWKIAYGTPPPKPKPQPKPKSTSSRRGKRKAAQSPPPPQNPVYGGLFAP